MSDGPIRRNRGFIIFSLVILALVLFPVFGLFNRVEPIVFGLPFGLAWIVGVIFAEFVGAVIFYWRDARRGMHDE